jgi:hypothetical protein
MATDQEIRDAGWYGIPQQKYLQNPFQIPTPDDGGDGGDGGGGAGIPYTNAADNFSSTGNAFGYGTAVQPGDKSVITSGPYEGQSGYYNSLNYTGGLPGDASQKGPGRYFDYEFTQPNADGDLVNIATGNPATGEFYKDYTLQPEKELPKWMQSSLAFLPGGRFVKGYLDKKMNPGMTGMTAAEIDKNYGGGEGGATYGIAGLSDTQKQYYDALAGQNMLFSGQQGFKTLTGKNFTGKGYVEGQLDIYNDYLSDEFKNMTEEEIDAAIAKQKENKKGQWKWKKMKESKAIYDANQNQIEKAAAESRKKSAELYDPNVHGDTNYGLGADNQQSYANPETPGIGWSATGSGPVSNKTGKGRTDWADGGRIYLDLGGLASIL